MEPHERQVAEQDAGGELAEHRGLAEARGQVASELRRHENDREPKDDGGDGIDVRSGRRDDAQAVEIHAPMIEPRVAPQRIPVKKFSQGLNGEGSTSLPRTANASLDSITRAGVMRSRRWAPGNAAACSRSQSIDAVPVS